MGEDTGGPKIFLFLVGMGLGFSVTSLFVSQSGAETREAIGEWVDKGREYVRPTDQDVFYSVGPHGADEPSPPRKSKSVQGVGSHGTDDPPPPRTGKVTEDI